MSSYALRLPESLKQAAKRLAAIDNTTMNQFFVIAIAEKISSMETAKFFEQRATLVNAGDAQAAWDKVGADTAVAEDTWTKQIPAKPFDNMRNKLLNLKHSKGN